MSNDADRLPGVLAAIEEIAGRDAALALALHLGGRSIHVPQAANLSAVHPLARAVGDGAAAAIAERHGGECLYVPMARRALARALHAKGVPPRSIAARLGISISAARRYRR